MTEAEWLGASNPDPMFRYLDRIKYPRQRKPRLLAVACCRHRQEQLPASALDILLLVERVADGLMPEEELLEAARAALLLAGAPETAYHYAVLAVEEATFPDPGVPYVHRLTDVTRRLRQSTGQVERTGMPAHARLVREIFGNPFRPVAFCPSWRTSTVVALAAQMYESREFGAMPILTDVLQDAGCDNAEVLDHCRGDGPHVRGCWVVDLVLGKE